ncbi:gap junction epsilon-1 protein [Hemiscyllium ocellatum]|uniref:gap junction epsilon-1 protein n=1 Tax=Hemiscyllium ocellatum TaxID=170820 RepID=UPI00296730D8|nr:gap junction epsilon-1 protein [Hemiscyllium ocellatum]
MELEAMFDDDIIKLSQRVMPSEMNLRPLTAIGQFCTLFCGSVLMFFLGALGFAMYGIEALYFNCDPDRKQLNLFCHNHFQPITFPWLKAMNQIYNRPASTTSCSCPVYDHLQGTGFSHLFGFQVQLIFRCNATSLDKHFNITKCMVSEHFEKTIPLSAINSFIAFIFLLCTADVFELLRRRLGNWTSP